jgi:ubiquinol-cytochrome c reductase cytochrome b subunit/menaquinol-cytochrome c reductase cytochrome b/c subunit
MPTPARITAQGGATLAQFEKGKLVVGQSGCLACHKIGENGNDGPGPNLTDIASRLPSQAIARTLINPTAPMPSFAGLQKTSPDKFNALVAFLGQLRGDG